VILLIVSQMKKLLFFLETFDKCWKDDSMKKIFPFNARDIVEDIERKVEGISSLKNISNTFAMWGTIGVWNVSDLLTFLLTSRITMLMAESIEKDSKENLKDEIRYLLYFINYLLSTNIHPPSESHKDHIPFHRSNVPFCRTYKDAQDKMREKLAEYFAKEIWNNHADYVEEIKQETGESIESKEDLEKIIKNKFLPYKTPPFLIKNVGLAKELFLFYKLISEDIGYVIPTLLYQRIFKGVQNLLSGKSDKPILTRVPDFIVIKGGRVMGVELGREREIFGTQKGSLVSTFSGVCGIPTTQVNILITNPNLNKSYDLGYKCNRCYRSFRLCDAFIEGEVNGDSFYLKTQENLKCVDICGAEKAERCMDAVIYTKIKNYESGLGNTMLVHFKCLLNDEKNHELNLYPIFPTVDGLEILKEGLL